MAQQYRAQFYGSIKGSSSLTGARTGSKGSGMELVAASKQGAIQVNLRHEKGVDYAEVTLVSGIDKRKNTVIYTGPVSGLNEETIRGLSIDDNGGKPVPPPSLLERAFNQVAA